MSGSNQPMRFIPMKDVHKVLAARPINVQGRRITDVRSLTPAEGYHVARAVASTIKKEGDK